jgi:hypothetical protein
LRSKKARAIYLGRIKLYRWSASKYADVSNNGAVWRV